MAKLFGSIAVAVADVYLLRQFGLDAPSVPPPLAAGLLVVLNLVAGIGIGDAFRRSFSDSVVALNQRLAKQNDELAECNQMLLAKLTDGTALEDDEEDLLDPTASRARL